MKVELKFKCAVCGHELPVEDVSGMDILVQPCPICEGDREYRCSCGKPLEVLDYDIRRGFSSTNARAAKMEKHTPKQTAIKNF